MRLVKISICQKEMNAISVVFPKTTKMKRVNLKAFGENCRPMNRTGNVQSVTISISLSRASVIYVVKDSRWKKLEKD